MILICVNCYDTIVRGCVFATRAGKGVLKILANANAGDSYHEAQQVCSSWLFSCSVAFAKHVYVRKNVVSTDRL